MRLRDVVVKHSLGRIFLHHLKSSYFIEINAHTLQLIQSGLRQDPDRSDDADVLLERLTRRGLVADGPFVPILERKGSPIISVEIEPIGKCNLSCRHCYVDFSRQAMSEEIFERLMEGLRELGVVEVSLNGGELFLHPQSLAWIERLRTQDLRVIIFTNGTLITEECARRMADAWVAQVIVSLDGFEKEHDAMRAKGAFARTTAGIRRMVEAGLSVDVTTVVHPDNLGDIEKLRSFCKETLGVRRMRLSTVIPMGKAIQHPELQVSQETFCEIHARPTTESPIDAASSSYLPCHAGVDKLYISSTGAVYACHLLAKTTHLLGDLHAQSLFAIHRHSQDTPQARMLWNFDIHQLHACANCPYLLSCRGGCRARAIEMTGDAWGRDPISCKKYGVLVSV